MKLKTSFDEDNFEEEIDKIQKTTEENEEAVLIVEDILDCFEQMNKKVCDLELLNNSKFAADLAFDLTRKLDDILEVIQTNSKKVKQNDLFSSLSSKIRKYQIT